MGKSLASLLGLGGSSHSSTKVSKLKNLLGLAVARLTILKNHHQARCSLAHSDIAQLLQLGHSCSDERALLRAEMVVKEENMLDVFAIVQSYCHLISERSTLLQRQKECPRELKEAVSSLIYASSRSGEMPELQHVCKLFSSMFGREFVRAATELRNSCGVNPKIVQKLSTRQPSLESRVRIIKEIAAEKGISLDVDEDQFVSPETEKVDLNSAKIKNHGQSVVDSGQDSTSGRSVHSYKDVASAAQAACEMAEDAAAAARAAVELSRPSQSSPDDHDHKRNDPEKNDANKGVEQLDENSKLEKGKVHRVQYYSSESEEEDDTVLVSDKNGEISADEFMKWQTANFQSGFYSDSTDATLREKKPNKYASWGSRANNENPLFDPGNETETGEEEGLSSEERSQQSLQMERQFSAGSTEVLSEKKSGTYLNPLYQIKDTSTKLAGESFKSSLYPDSDAESDRTGLLDAASNDNLAYSYHSETNNPQTVHVNYTKKSPTKHSKVTRRAVSVRTRRGMQK